MIRTKLRPWLLAALVLAGGVVPVVAATPSAGAAVLFGLDCGALGVLEATSWPANYRFDGVLSLGPYDTPGTNSRISCTLRRDTPTGTILHTWSLASSASTVPAQHEYVTFSHATTTPVSALYLCSRVTWQTVNGPQAASGCERAGNLEFYDTGTGGGWFDIWEVEKPQDTDLDNNYP